MPCLLLAELGTNLTANILHAASLYNTAQVLCEAAAVYKADTDAITLKVKQEFAAKDRKQTIKKGGCHQSAR